MEEINLFVPGRLGLIGEITDLVSPYLSQNNKLIPGQAISIAMDKGIYSKVKKSDKFIYKFQDQYFECEMSEVALKKETETNTFYSYICGTILFLKQNYKISGIEINIEKMDLPMKKGLSSSAAICITIVKAYNQLYKLNLSDDEIKEIAYEGEHLAQSKCGRLDQESIMNKEISHITFYENKSESKKIYVKENIYLLIVDLKGNKNTKAIMKRFNEALPYAKNDEDKLVHDILQKSQNLVELSVKSLEEGNIAKLGELIKKAQILMDKASVTCEELKAPLLHSILEDKYIIEQTYGGKGIGSGGDGSALLICKNKDKQVQLSKYIKDKHNMESIKFCINKSKKREI